MFYLVSSSLFRLEWEFCFNQTIEHFCFIIPNRNKAFSSFWDSSVTREWNKAMWELVPAWPHVLNLQFVHPVPTGRWSSSINRPRCWWSDSDCYQWIVAGQRQRVIEAVGYHGCRNSILQSKARKMCQSAGNWWLWYNFSGVAWVSAGESVGAPSEATLSLCTSEMIQCPDEWDRRGTNLGVLTVISVHILRVWLTLARAPCERMGVLCRIMVLSTRSVLWLARYWLRKQV